MADIDWRMSAALHDVARGGTALPEVASLEAAVRAWCDLDAGLQDAAVLTPERTIMLDDDTVVALEGQAIRRLADRLPLVSIPPR